jgi:hypothetical protein
MTPFEKALVAHLVADWILQNDWMALNKKSLRHPAAWTHAAVHGLCLGLVLGGLAGLVLGLAHLLIDTRVPLNWWMRSFKKCDTAPDAGVIAVWLDQTFHILCLALWVAFVKS